MADTTVNPAALRPCIGCGAAPDSDHNPGCGQAVCAATGEQYIACPGELHEFDGREYGEHEGRCAPVRYRGQSPTEEAARERGWYCRFVPNRGFFPVAATDVDARLDLNRVVAELRWDPTSQRFTERQR